MLDRKLASGEWAAHHADVDGGVDAQGYYADLPLIAAAIVHAERQDVVTSKPAVAGGQRSHWKTVARREALGGMPWS